MHPDADERHLPPRPQGRKCNDGPTAFAAPGIIILAMAMLLLACIRYYL